MLTFKAYEHMRGCVHAHTHMHSILVSFDTLSYSLSLSLSKLLSLALSLSKLPSLALSLSHPCTTHSYQPASLAIFPVICILSSSLCPSVPPSPQEHLVFKLAPDLHFYAHSLQISPNK